MLIGAAIIGSLIPASANSLQVLVFERVGPQNTSLRPWTIEVGAVEQGAPMCIRVPQKAYDKITEALDADARSSNDIPTPQAAFLVKEQVPPSGRVWQVHSQGVRAIISIVRTAYAARKRSVPAPMSYMEADDAPQ